MRLEVGVGFARENDMGRKRYRFKPRIFGDDVVYMDLFPPEVNVRGEWVVGDCQMMPFRKHAFSEVYASHVIEHLERLGKFVWECRFVLKLGGKLHLWTPNFLSVNATRDPDHKHVFNFLNIRKVFSKYGFDVHYASNVASKLPKPLRYLFKLLFLVFCDELEVVCYKEPLLIMVLWR